VENPYRMDFENSYGKFPIKFSLENPIKNLKVKRHVTDGPGRQ
jgi:hypothetical protein